MTGTLLTTTIATAPIPGRRYTRASGTPIRAGDIDNSAESPHDAYAATLAFSDRYPEYSGLAAELRVNGAPRPPLTGFPMVAEVGDLGGDPAAAVAPVVAARYRNPALVITGGEHPAADARYARWLLDLPGRTDVPVVPAVTDTPGPADEPIVENWVPHRVAPQQGSALTAVTAVVQVNQGLLRWAGYSSVTVLDQVPHAIPEFTDRLVVTLAPAAPRPGAEDPAATVKLEGQAVRVVAATLDRVPLIPGSGAEDTVIGPGDELYRALTAPQATGWGAVLGEHLRQWFAAGHPVSVQHVSLTVTVALELPNGNFDKQQLALDVAIDIATTVTPTPGIAVFVLADPNPDYASLRYGLTGQLTDTGTTPILPGAGSNG